MVDPRGSEPLGFDRAHCAAVVTRALQLPGGPELVTGSLSGVPGVVVTRRRSGLFGGPSLSVQLAHWRYEPANPGRLSIAHVVEGTVLAENVTPPVEAGAHVAMALHLLLNERGPRVLPDILGLLEGLTVAAG